MSDIDIDDLAFKPSLFELIVPDAACNMKCKYCFGEHSTNIRNVCHTRLDPNALDKVLGHIDHNADGAVTIWGGEPLFNKEQLEETVSYIKSRFANAVITIVSNGSLLTDYWTKFIIDNNIMVNLSHDGPGQKYRGIDYLEVDELKNNVAELRRHHKFKVFNTVIHLKNPSIEKAIQYFMQKEDELKVELGVAPRLIRYTGASSEEFMFKPEDFHFLDENADFVVNTFARALLSNDAEFVQHYLGVCLRNVVMHSLDKIHTGSSPEWKDNYPYCGTLEQLKYTITGERIFCNGATENGDITRAKWLLNNYKSWDKCKTCSVNYACSGICAALTHEQLARTCEQHKYFIEGVESRLRKLYHNETN